MNLEFRNCVPCIRVFPVQAALGLGVALMAMMSSCANANSARVDLPGAPTDPGLADTLPPDTEGVLTFSKVDIDLDVAPQTDGPVDLDLDLDDMVSTDPMFDACIALASTHATVPALPESADAMAASVDRPTVTVVDFVAAVPPTMATDWPDTDRPLPPSWGDKRVMVVSADESERMYLRARLALAHLVWVDEAATTTQALTALGVRPYAMAFINLDSVAIDGTAIAARLRLGNPLASLVLTSNAVSGGHPFNLVARWRRWQLGRHLGHDHNAEVLAKPLVPRDVIELLSRLTTPLVV